MNTDAAALRAYYERGRERDRLARGAGELEFVRTAEIVARTLPPAPAVVADIGGGPGRYSLWLASLGYRVEHRDLMELHVSQVTADAADAGTSSAIRAEVGDARDLDLPDACVDAVLLLGPLYHLPGRAERIRALREASRILRPGGQLYAAAITRWAMRVDAILAKRAYLDLPVVLELVGETERTGLRPPLFEGGFTGYTHRPGDLRDELADAGLTVTDLVCVEGPAATLPDVAERLADPLDREVLLGAARALERVPELLGFGPHLLATATR